MRSRGAAALLTLVATAGLTACGSADNGNSSSGGSSRSSKSAQDILSEVSAAIAKVKSYHLEGTQTDAQDGHVTLAADVSAAGKLKGSFNNEGKDVQFVVVGNDSYLKANNAFWKDQGGSDGPKIAKVLEGKWVKAPGGASSFLRGLLPKDIGYCLQRDSGTLSKGPNQTVGGAEMVVISNQGDKPGTSPGELYVPAEGAALPTRLTQTGKDKPGGKPDPRCDDDDSGSTTTDADIRLSNYDKPVDITAPKGALSPEDLLKGGTAPQEQTS